jgi:hypothetical protein
VSDFVTEIIDVTPHQSLMPKLGKSGYSIPQAIAELVDNAIDARIEGTPLRVSVKIGKNDISVADDGLGMDRQEIQDAMVLGKSSKLNKLGEFGLGLKTSCTNLGQRFTVMTSKLGESYEYVVEYDESRWVSAQDHWKLQLGVRDVDPASHFTIVQVSSLNKYYPGLVEAVVRDLQQRFAPFIADGSVTLKVNTKTCRPETFDLIEDTRSDFETHDRHGNRIYGWYGLLKQGSNKGLYGFHTYRLGRMITTYDKIGIGEHPTISRIIGEIHLDHVPVTHNKREFDRESGLFREAEAALRVAFQELLRQARQRASSDSITKAVRNELERWKDSIARALGAKELREFASVAASLSEPEPDANGSHMAELDAERRERREPEVEEPTTAGGNVDDSVRERVPRNTQKKPRHAVKVKGKTIDFNHEFAPLGEREAWYRWSLNDDKGLDIYTNTQFPAYFATRDKAFYATVHIVESIAQLLVRETGAGPEELEDIRQLLLRKSAAVKDQWVEDEDGAWESA